MATYIRVVREIAPGINNIPNQAISWTVGDKTYIDYVFEGTDSDIPNNSIYAAKIQDGIFSEPIQAPADFIFKNTPAGWDPKSYAIPVP